MKVLLSYLSAIDASDSDRACLEALKTVVETMYESTYYRPFMDAYPIRVNQQIPKATLKHLTEQDAPACFDGTYVCIHTENVLKMHDQIHSKLGHVALVSSFNTILPHEYMHIMAQHASQRKAMFEVEPEYARELELACEIEANRAYTITKDSVAYKLGVTEELFPAVKNLTFLDQIYDWFKKQKDENTAVAKQIAKAYKNADQTLEEIMEDKSITGKEKILTEAIKQMNGAKHLDEPSWDGNGAKRALSDAYGGLRYDKVDGKDNHDGGDGKGQGMGKGGNSKKPQLLNITSDVIEQIAAKAQHVRELRYNLQRLKATLNGEVKRTREATYSRQSRKYQNGDIIKKGTKLARNKRPKVLVALDASGSMNARAVKTIANTIKEISIALGGQALRENLICIYSGEIEDTVKLKDAGALIKSYSPCGGTDYLAVAQLAIDLNCQAIINITDGEGCYGLEASAQQLDKIRQLKLLDVLVCNNDIVTVDDRDSCIKEDQELGIVREQISVA